MNYAHQTSTGCSRIVIWCRLLLASFLACLLGATAHAGTYASSITTFNWIDPSGHTRVSATSLPYQFINGTGCGTSLPTIDDNISNVIPIGFNFLFGDRVFDSVRIMTNGRLQFVNAAIPWDNTTCGFGSPVTQLPIPNASMNYVMRIYGNDLDPTPRRSGYATLCQDGVTAANNPCYVSFATIGAAPNRRFVVSWKGVPEWVSSGAKGAYDVQIIVQENGEFIYQYGPYVAGPSATAGQVGYQISTTNYEIPFSGFPAQNYAIRFFVPHPLVEYLMEQSAWSGTGAVIDTSGSDKHGTPIGSVNTVSGAKVCRGADIPSNANTNNIDAIDTGLNVSSDIGNAGSIAFWYKAKSAWSGSSVKDAQLFDASIVNNQWFFVVRQANGRLRFVVRDSNGNDRIAETNAITTTANTWRHIAVTWNFNPMITANNNKLTIYVDGVQRAQTAFTSTTTNISTQLGALYIGDNRSGFTGLNGTGRSADAVIDEVRIYNYELSTQGVASLMNLNAACLGHYSITHSGSGTSCQVAPITIASHTLTHDPFVNNNLINLTTTDNLGNWSLITGRGVLTPGPANSGTATYRFNAEANVVLGLAHPVGTVSVDVSDGAAVDLENSPITITSTGCAPDRFNACHDFPTSQCKAGSRLFTRKAGSSFNTDVVGLDAAGNLDSSFSGKAVVSLIARAVPGGVDAQNCFVPDAGGTQVLDNAVTSFVSGRLTVSAAIPAAWREARIKVVCDSTHCAPSGLTSCSADNFAIRPGGVTIPVSSMATPPSATATPTIAAGSPFLVTASTDTAPNDGYAGTLVLDSTKLTAQNTSQDSTIQSGGTVGSLTLSSPLVANQTPTSGNAIYTEVGYLYLTPGAFRDDTFATVDQGFGDCIAFDSTNPTNADYLSASLIGGKYGCSVGNATTVSFGRFRPHHFDTAVTPACAAGGFTYSGQPFPLTVTARSQLGGTTANYTGRFAKTMTFSEANGSSGTFSPATLAAASFVNGLANLATTPSVSYAFSTKPATPAIIKLRVTDSDGVSSLLGSEGMTMLRSGRLRFVNYYGSELIKPRVEYRAEYWDGSRWMINSADTCTSLVAGNIATGGLSVSALTALNNGIGFITFNTALAGSYDIALDLNAIGVDTSCNSTPPPHGGSPANKPWLQGYWAAPASCGGVAAWAQDPSARVRLGSPHAPYIYLRERY